MPRALVTGAAGFVGQWLCRELLAGGWAVIGTRLHDEVSAPGGLPAPERRAVEWRPCDLRDDAEVRALLGGPPLDAVFHLAGIASPRDAEADPAGTLEVNTVAAARLLSLLARERTAGTADPVVIVVGSGEQYGVHPASAQPLGESAAQRPLGVYAASKAAQEVVALAIARSGLRVIAVRPFNHSGPGQSSRFVLPALARRALALRDAPASTRVLGLGDATPVRDFCHVYDVVRAYVQLAARGEPGCAYNVASGEGVSITELAERVLARAGVDATLERDPAFGRTVDVPMLVGDPTRLRQTTGWRPERSLDSLIDDVLDAPPN